MTTCGAPRKNSFFAESSSACACTGVRMGEERVSNYLATKCVTVAAELCSGRSVAAEVASVQLTANSSGVCGGPSRVHMWSLQIKK